MEKLTVCEKCLKSIPSNHNHGMSTAVWGPPAWLFLHCVVMGYPCCIKTKEDNQRKRDMYLFFETLGNVLPCKYCRKSYQEFMNELPIEPYLSSRQDLSYWLYIIHKKVNDKLNKPTLSFKKYNEMFEQYRANACKNGGCHNTLHKPKCKIKIVSQFPNSKKKRRSKRKSKRK